MAVFCIGVAWDEGRLVLMVLVDEEHGIWIVRDFLWAVTCVNGIFT
jgi:hypothetical protein